MPRKITTVPTMFYSWAASYFVNNDPSGITEIDQKEADAFVEEVIKKTGCSFVTDCSEQTEFGRPSINGSIVKGFPAGDIVEYTFARWEDK